MTKDKYERKKQDAGRKAQHSDERTVIVENRETGDNEAEGAAKAGSKNTNNQKPSWWERVTEYIGGTLFTNQAIAAFTFVLAGAAIYQFIITDRQLDTMRKDQRPWIRVDLDGTYIQQNSDMFAIVHLLNKGKTPARRVQGDLFVERVKSGEEPMLDSPNPHERISEGIQFPDMPSQFVPIKRVHSLEAGQVDPAPVSEAEFRDWSSGATYFVIYGNISYTDYYSVKHWTKFCVPLVASSQSGDTNPKWIPFRKCTDYGDVDGN